MPIWFVFRETNQFSQNLWLIKRERMHNNKCDVVCFYHSVCLSESYHIGDITQNTTSIDRHNLFKGII